MSYAREPRINSMMLVIVIVIVIILGLETVQFQILLLSQFLGKLPLDQVHLMIMWMMIMMAMIMSMATVVVSMRFVAKTDFETHIEYENKYQEQKDLFSQETHHFLS